MNMRTSTTPPLSPDPEISGYLYDTYGEIKTYTYLVTTEKAQWTHAVGIRMDIDTDTNNLNIYDSNGDIRYIFNKWDRVEVVG